MKQVNIGDLAEEGDVIDITDISIHQSKYPEAATWPPIEEIFGQHELPEKLAELLAERYAEHSSEYASDIEQFDGKFINTCMFKDNLQDVEEELVDAIFNTLVYLKRGGDGEELLERLLGAWELVRGER